MAYEIPNTPKGSRESVFSAADFIFTTTGTIPTVRKIQELNGGGHFGQVSTQLQSWKAEKGMTVIAHGRKKISETTIDPTKNENLKKLSLEATSYTFADYFKLINEVDSIVGYFGYQFSKDYLPLPCSRRELTRLDDLKLRLEENLRYATLTNEAAKREFLIAPVISELIHYTHTRVRVEFSLVVDEQLKGSLDYLLESPHHNLLVIKAKNGDLEQGIKQLAVELIALDRWLETDTAAPLYGVVSIGNVWQFSVLQRTDKQLIQDLNLFRLPADVENLLRVMISLLEETLPLN